MVMPDSTFPAADESPHGAATLEWWFVQGYYEGRRSGRRDFMTSFFRLRVGLEEGPKADTYSLLLSVLNPETSQTTFRSQIDAPMLDWITGEGRKAIQETNLDQELLEVFFEGLATQGLPPPFHVEKVAAVVQAQPLRVAWQDFGLEQTHGTFHLTYQEPETRRECAFHLHPLTPRREVDPKGEGSPPQGRMPYFTYPRLRLTGRAGEEEVKGEAWLDHQWGNSSWLATCPGGGRRVLGWDWFGCNLDDGSDWVVMVHRDAQTREPVGSQVTMWDGRERTQVCHDVSLTPLRTWHSPSTFIGYPVACLIEIPSMKATLTFEPAADDQEVPVIGPARAIWEGAGSVSGTVAGRQVQGRARGEFQGYGYIFDFQALLDGFAHQLDRAIEEFLPREITEERLQAYVGPPQRRHEPRAYTAVLAQPVWDLLSRQPRRWRPACGVILLLEALGTRSGPYQDLVGVLPELIYTGSLIIDDIEDHSEVRRGGESIHLRYGMDVAINAANTLYFLPGILVLNHPGLTVFQRGLIYQALHRVFVRVHFGQALDIYLGRYLTPGTLSAWIGDEGADKVLQMYAYKVGAFVEGFAEVATIIAGAGHEVRQACMSFGREFGVAFQITDDVRNFSESPGWTKTCGEDLAEGKLTYVILRALGALDGPEQERLAEILGSETLRRDPDALREGIRLVCQSGVLETCTREARDLVEGQWKILAPLLPPSEAKMILSLLYRKILELPHDV